MRESTDNKASDASPELELDIHVYADDLLAELSKACFKTLTSARSSPCQDSVHGRPWHVGEPVNVNRPARPSCDSNGHNRFITPVAFKPSKWATAYSTLLFALGRSIQKTPGQHGTTQVHYGSGCLLILITITLNGSQCGKQEPFWSVASACS